MAEKILDGSNSILVRTMVDALVPLFDSEAKVADFEKRFTAALSATPEAKKHPRLKRHAAEVVMRLQSRALVREDSSATADPEIIDLPPVDVDLPALKEFLTGDSRIGSVRLPNTLDEVMTPKMTSSLADLLDPEASAMERAEADEMHAKLKQYAEEYANSREHPFLRKYVHTFGYGPCGSQTTYMVVGTSVGKMANGTSYNANCTTGNHRKIKDAGADVLVHKVGRPVSVCHETERGDRYFVWLLRYRAGMQLRFWVNTVKDGVRGDVPSGNRRVVITDSKSGWEPAES